MSNRVSFVRYEHITMGLIRLGIKKLIIFRAGVFRQITMTIDAIIQGKISIYPWFTRKKYHPVLISTARLKRGLPTVHSILFFRMQIEIIANLRNML